MAVAKPAPHSSAGLTDNLPYLHSLEIRNETSSCCYTDYYGYGVYPWPLSERTISSRGIW